mgnify:CR=1 FL=1
MKSSSSSCSVSVCCCVSCVVVTARIIKTGWLGPDLGKQQRAGNIVMLWGKWKHITGTITRMLSEPGQIEILPTINITLSPPTWPLAARGNIRRKKDFVTFSSSNNKFKMNKPASPQWVTSRYRSWSHMEGKVKLKNLKQRVLYFLGLTVAGHF